MPKILDVYLLEQHIGHLIQEQGGRMEFQYLESWLNNPDAVALSHSLPLRVERYTQKECKGFFSGLLPEGDNRDLVAKILGTSPSNDFRMLREIGGECAGAVTILPHEKHLEKPENSYERLDDNRLSEVLRQLPTRPLMAGAKGIRLSQAGAQDKLPVHVSGGQISLPLGNSPSTHILKPGSKYLEDLVVNEAFCMKLAALCELEVAGVEIQSAQQTIFLLIERYDRKLEGNRVVRLHQEDFCQALGIAPERKYQSDGGPSLKNCFQLILNASNNPVLDLRKFWNGVVFNHLIGNNDAHGKNFSFIYENRKLRFAPLYDLVCTAYYSDVDERAAMKIGRENKFRKIGLPQFNRLADDVVLGKPQLIQAVLNLAQKVLDVVDNVKIDHPVAAKIAEIVKSRSEIVQGKLGRRTF